LATELPKEEFYRTGFCPGSKGQRKLMRGHAPANRFRPLLKSV